MLRLIDLNLCGIEIAAVARDNGVCSFTDGRIILHGILEVGETGGDGFVNDKRINWCDIAHRDELRKLADNGLIRQLVMGFQDETCGGKRHGRYKQVEFMLLPQLHYLGGRLEELAARAR